MSAKLALNSRINSEMNDCFTGPLLMPVAALLQRHPYRLMSLDVPLTRCKATFRRRGLAVSISDVVLLSVSTLLPVLSSFLLLTSASQDPVR
jgi:hypothetical protein